MRDCVILGPSKIQKIKKFGYIQDVKKYVKQSARFFSKNYDSILLIPDDGVPLEIAKEFKKINKHKNVIGYMPGKAKGGKDISRYYKYFDEIKDIEGGWFNLNTELTRKSDHIFCLGFSAGVFIELCSIKYNQIYLNLNSKIFIDERCISYKLPKEVEIDLNNLTYFNKYELLEKSNIINKNDKTK